MLDIYTLKSCDTCRKAIKWLETSSIKARVHDIRDDGIPVETIAAAIQDLGWEKILNRRSTTWRNLDEALKQDMTEAKALSLITENPTLMKRPLFVTGDIHIAGFDKTAQARLQARLAEITP